MISHSPLLLNRREWLASSAALAAPAPAPKGTAISFNEDDSHFFSTRAGKKLSVELVDSFIDQYANTQIREMMLCPNCMRTSYGSKVWDPIWRGYDPNGPDDQPLLASTEPAGRAGARKWIHTAWQLDQMGIDVYARWIVRCRKVGISPWLSMRMNDIHNVNDERSYIHSEFWRENPQFRRVPYRFAGWTDRAFDYGRPEVREYHMKLIRELAERYDFDGLELDWMRFGYHFRPGQEREGARLLTEFTGEVRRLLNRWEQRRGHKIRLGARVASRPQSALGLGMDAVRWAQLGLVDMIVITPFWATAEFDMPVEEWKQLLRGTPVLVAAGLEVLVRPFPEYRTPQTNSLETTRGAAAALLERGADRIYLFNFMDSETAIDDLHNYKTLLSEVGSLDTLAGKARRHVITYADTWAPGEPRPKALPQECAPGRWVEFRLPLGPKPASGSAAARLGIRGPAEGEVSSWEVRVNGELCAFAGAVSLASPRPEAPVFAFQIPSQALNAGYNVIEVAAKHTGRIEWVEVAFRS